MVNLIFAYSPQNNVFGNQGKLPWPKCGMDLQMFKDVTDNSVIIMGRKTWDSLPHRLHRRTHVVISASGNVEPINGEYPDDVFSSLDQAIKQYAAFTCYVIGGPSLLEEAIDKYPLNEVYMTQFLTVEPYKGDVFLSDTFLRKVAEKYQLDSFVDTSKDEMYPTKEVRIMKLVPRTTFGG